MARFLTSKEFSEIQAETMGWKYGSERLHVSLLLSIFDGRHSERKKNIHPLIIVVIANRPHSTPAGGSANNAISSGMTQNSPNMQWNVLSFQYSLLYANASISTICSAAEGMESMLELKVEKPRRLRVRER